MRCGGSISAGLVALFLIPGALVTAQPKPPAFASGEVIVKFAPGSKAAQKLARASAQGNLSDAGLTSCVESLARKAGIPLQIKQFGSGGNLVLAIRQGDLVADLVKRLQANPNIKATRVVPAQGLAGPSVEVDFAAGSPEAQAVERVAASGHETGPELRPLTDKLANETGVPWTGHATSPRQMRLMLDLGTLTIELAKRLSKSPDVESAQPNAMRRPMGTAANVPPGFFR